VMPLQHFYFPKHYTDYLMNVPKYKNMRYPAETKKKL
jgi:hypothetical protein